MLVQGQGHFTIGGPGNTVLSVHNGGRATTTFSLGAPNTTGDQAYAGMVEGHYLPRVDPTGMGTKAKKTFPGYRFRCRR